MTATETSARRRDGFLADAAETRFAHPAFLDALAAGRQVVVFDDRGTSRSTGEATETVESRRRRRGRVRACPGPDAGGRPRLVVAGSSAGGVPDLPAPPAKVGEVLAHEHNGDEDLLFLSPSSSRTAPTTS
ncbi:hypothetical protein GCM10023221_12940 [Luteimicrobium xylanilyticum]|uniref:Uncharacterized protein n=1 Tax=Luteimicrobium xylanilyticum TaxID=1133546 RepID=A0A5P9QCP8_9MICO|nr:hypothetical protein [Luteimicrobium xylanilyticum]QFU99233.1 hypothetical protein KDY119_02760 [Luteimicrobium xylanilyticum]